MNVTSQVCVITGVFPTTSWLFTTHTYEVIDLVTLLNVDNNYSYHSTIKETILGFLEGVDV